MDTIINNVVNNKTPNTSILQFERNNRSFLFIGEVHSGIKDDISSFLDTKEKILTIIECREGVNKIPINKIKKHYKKRLVLNRETNDDSYIDNHLFYFSNKYKTILNGNKSLKEISDTKNVKVLCIDKRDPKDFKKTQSKTLYKNDIDTFIKIKRTFIQLKAKIGRLKESSIKTKLFIEINKVLNEKLTSKSSFIVQTLSEIILDFEILKQVLNGKDNVVGIFGKNHINNIKNYIN